MTPHEDTDTSACPSSVPCYCEKDIFIQRHLLLQSQLTHTSKNLLNKLSFGEIKKVYALFIFTNINIREREEEEEEEENCNILVLLRHVLLYLFICHSITDASIYLIKCTPLYLPKM